MKKSRYSEEQVAYAPPAPVVATVRYAWLVQTLFESIEHVQETATRWLWTFNHERPNMALGSITPIQKLALAA